MAGCKTSVGKDGGVDPGQERGDSRVHIGQILQEFLFQFKRKIKDFQRTKGGLIEVNLYSFVGKPMTGDARQDVDAILLHSEGSSTIALLSRKVMPVKIFSLSAHLICTQAMAPSTRAQHRALDCFILCQSLAINVAQDRNLDWKENNWSPKNMSRSIFLPKVTKLIT